MEKAGTSAKWRTMPFGENVTQANMAGTGIATFSDRGRDAIRGGGAFDRGQALVARQGFINGLWYDSNGSGNASLQQLLDTGDLVKLALAGTIKDYRLTDSHGAEVEGARFITTANLRVMPWIQWM